MTDANRPFSRVLRAPYLNATRGTAEEKEKVLDWLRVKFSNSREELSASLWWDQKLRMWRLNVDTLYLNHDQSMEELTRKPS